MTATPNQLAETLTARILNGQISPGSKLLEASLAADLGVSRNTLREAFRMLARDGLVEHIPHRGVFVRCLTPAEVVELFAYRRFIEVNALSYFGTDMNRTQRALTEMAHAIAQAEAAANAENWGEVGTCNNEFHAALVSVVGVPRLKENLRLAMAHSRLAFMSVGTNENVHAPFLGRNKEILQFLTDSRLDTAKESLLRYLQESEARILGEMTLGG
ncbi:GntR family transcriptional regulator [Staphylococcus chromogenes]|nr:GntR family transcriptional regulator [Staphylococcus chromogenes]